MFRFAEETGPHITITSDKLFEIGGLTVTNSILYGWFCSIVIIALFIAARKRLKLKGTQGPAGLLEAGTEFMVNLLDNSFGDRKLAIKLTPIFASVFFFIMFSNWLGLVPGVGQSVEYDGNPLLRPFTADLNGTAALALFGIILVQIVAIRINGIKGHIKHYFPLKIHNPFNYLVGAFELFTELTRLLSLGLRLFLNIAVGEVLISVASYLGGTFAAPVAALPFTLLELFVGALQAYIFIVLCAAYLSAATAGHGEHGEMTDEPAGSHA
jgi:F-type H+-transporting ATPase subunit a